jgi:hypothetical protein
MCSFATFGDDDSSFLFQTFVINILVIQGRDKCRNHGAFVECRADHSSPQFPWPTTTEAVG